MSIVYSISMMVTSSDGSERGELYVTKEKTEGFFIIDGFMRFFKSRRE